jgi:hypothetical protein
MGAPLIVPKMESKSITEADLNKYHTEFMDKLTELFDKHKANYGYPNAQLEIV